METKKNLEDYGDYCFFQAHRACLPFVDVETAKWVPLSTHVLKIVPRILGSGSWDMIMLALKSILRRPSMTFVP